MNPRIGRRVTSPSQCADDERYHAPAVASQSRSQLGLDELSIGYLDEFFSVSPCFPSFAWLRTYAFQTDEKGCQDGVNPQIPAAGRLHYTLSPVNPFTSEQVLVPDSSFINIFG